MFPKTPKSVNCWQFVQKIRNRLKIFIKFYWGHSVTLFNTKHKISLFCPLNWDISGKNNLTCCQGFFSLSHCSRRGRWKTRYTNACGARRHTLPNLKYDDQEPQVFKDWIIHMCWRTLISSVLSWSRVYYIHRPTDTVEFSNPLLQECLLSMAEFCLTSSRPILTRD